MSLHDCLKGWHDNDGSDVCSRCGLDLNPPEEAYQNEPVIRSAPRWAWEVIDETLALDAQAGNFDKALKEQIQSALDAMIASSEEPS